MIAFETNIRVRYAETDAMGVAHHASYVLWMEVARVEFLDSIGLPLSEMEKNGFVSPVVQVNIAYKKPAFFDDRLTVHIALNKEPRARFGFDYKICRGEDLIATATTQHGFLNAKNMPCRPPEKFLEKIHALF